MAEIPRTKVSEHHCVSICLEVHPGFELRIKDISQSYLSRVFPYLVQWVQFHNEFNALHDDGQLQGRLSPDQGTQPSKGEVPGQAVEGRVEDTVSDYLHWVGAENKEDACGQTPS